MGSTYDVAVISKITWKINEKIKIKIYWGDKNREKWCLFDPCNFHQPYPVFTVLLHQFQFSGRIIASSLSFARFRGIFVFEIDVDCGLRVLFTVNGFSYRTNGVSIGKWTQGLGGSVVYKVEKERSSCHFTLPWICWRYTLFDSTCHSCCLCKYQLFGHFWYLTLYLLYYFGFSLNFLFRLILGFLQVGHFSNCDWYECFVSNLISWSSDPFFWLSLNFGSRIDDLLLFLDFSFLCYFFLCVIGSSIK